MAVLSAGKGESKYNIHISNKKIPKNVLNKILSTKNKVLIITDSGVPKQYLKSLIKDIKKFYKSNQGASGSFMDQMVNNNFLELNNN